MWNTDLLRIIIQTGTDDAEAVRGQYPAMQLVDLVLLVLLFLIADGRLIVSVIVLSIV